MPRSKTRKPAAKKAAAKTPRFVTDVLVNAFTETGKAFTFRVIGLRNDLIAAFTLANQTGEYVDVEVLNLQNTLAHLAFNPANVTVIGETYDADESTPKPPPPPPPQQPRAAAPIPRRVLTVDDLIRSGIIVPGVTDVEGDPGRGVVIN